MPHGDIAVLWQPLEYLIIGGVAASGFIIANPMNVIKGSMRGLCRPLRGRLITKTGISNF